MVNTTTKPKVIDLEDVPELARVVDEVSKTNTPVMLRRHGADEAVIEPIDAYAKRRGNESQALVEREALRRSAGGWQGLVDVEEFREANRDSRRRSSRPPVSL